MVQAPVRDAWPLQGKWKTRMHLEELKEVGKESIVWTDEWKSRLVSEDSGETPGENSNYKQPSLSFSVVIWINLWF